MELFYKTQRDLEFYNACERVRKGKCMTIQEIVDFAIMQPASSFFLTYSSCRKIIKWEKPVNGAKRELYYEIKRLRDQMPELTVSQACERIIEMPAPRFYITPARARSLYYELLKTKGNAIFTRYRIYNLCDNKPSGFRK